MLVNAYVEHRKVGWDFEDESPGRDARGFARDDASPPEVETHLVNTVLTNGARYYVDHAHPEFSTPECTDAMQAVRYDKAGERVLARSMQAASRLLPPGQEIVVYKNNSDGKGNSYGTHENYLVDRSVPFSTLVRHMIPWFVTRQVFTGAGKVGSEHGAAEVVFQVTQRADFFDEEVGLDSCGDEAQMADLMRRWEQVLTAVEDDPLRLDGQLDWVTKYNLLDAYAARNGLEWGDPKLALMDLQYHDVRPERSLYEKLVKAGKVERLLDEDDVQSAIAEPPATTRAYFRGRCLARWSDSVVAANWDSMIFDLGADPLKRIPMMEPLRGTKAHVDELLDGCATPAELVARLSA